MELGTELTCVITVKGDTPINLAPYNGQVAISATFKSVTAGVTVEGEAHASSAKDGDNWKVTFKTAGEAGEAVSITFTKEVGDDEMAAKTYAFPAIEFAGKTA